MDHAKNYLLDQHCAGIARSAVTSGYHRGRRPLIGKVYYPDIISIHHLHLHVIVCQHLVSRLFKHPAWLPLMWKSDARVLRDIRRQAWGVVRQLWRTARGMTETRGWTVNLCTVVSLISSVRFSDTSLTWERLGFLDELYWEGHPRLAEHPTGRFGPSDLWRTGTCDPLFPSPFTLTPLHSGASLESQKGSR